MTETIIKKSIHILRIILGIFLLILGIIGIFLPFLQGFLLIILAGIVLGKDSFLGKWIYRLIEYVKKKKQTTKSHQ
jgi:uncharacterized membrane protein YbaN (DUF454 family)